MRLITGTSIVGILLLASAATSTETAATGSAIDFEREVFYAVLEGLYQDGVRNDVVDGILHHDPRMGYVNFVPGCPLCVPALEAFRVYRARPKLESYKGGIDTWGPGLAKAEREALMSKDLVTRLTALPPMIERFVKRRVEMRRLTDGERRAWERKMEEGRKLGMKQLAMQKEQGLMDLWKGIDDCAVCDGANKPFGN